MRSETVTTVLEAPAETVFAYMRTSRTCPSGRPSLLRELVREGEDFKVRNGLGEFFFEIRADPATGVIDMFAGPSKREMAIFPTRVVGLPGGGSAYSFTMFQAPDMPDELFDSQYASLQREFRNIEGKLNAG